MENSYADVSHDHVNIKLLLCQFLSLLRSFGDQKTHNIYINKVNSFRMLIFANAISLI
jgi:hypothetical protein